MAATKYAPADWHTSNSVIQSTAERQRSTTHDIRQQSNTERNETNLTTRWTQYKTDCNLTSRISNLFDWKDALTRTLNDTEEEIAALTTSKRTAEYALDTKMMPLEVVLNCLQIRENRVYIDYVRDNVESELHKEVEVISGIRSFLQQRIGESFNQLSVLQMCHQQLAADVTDKHSALSIDSDCARLTNISDNVTMQSDPTRIKKGIVTPDQWEAYSSQNIRQTEDEIALSVRLREAINQTIRQTSNDLDSQWIATNSALRGRVHEMSQAKKELKWQKNNTEEEIDKVNGEVKSLEEALEKKVPPMMVAHTRLENRTYRPNVELCRDNPQHQLVDEVDQIATSQKSLFKKLQLALLGLGTLNRTLSRINDDISIKTNSLNIDQECLEMREKLSEHPTIQKILQMTEEEQKKQ